MRFNAQRFEDLSGLPLANYAVEMMQEPIPESDFLPYFLQNAERMDMAHLELAVGILAHVGTDHAIQKVATYLEHPDFNVRFVATKMIARLVAADEVVMSYVVQSLEKHAGDRAALASELRLLLNRPANDRARRIVGAFREKNGVPEQNIQSD